MGVMRPSGPLPPEVYWRRRALVLAALVLAVLGGVWVVNQVSGLFGRGDVTADGGGGAGDAAGGDTDAPAEDNAGVASCTPADLALTLASDATTYPAGVLPTFTLTLATTATSCLVDAGEAHQELVITSGTDRIWSSRDCAAADAQSRELRLAPSAGSETQVQWQRTRSVAGCAPDQAAALPGTYSAVLTLVGASSAPVVFTLQ